MTGTPNRPPLIPRALFATLCAALASAALCSGSAARPATTESGAALRGQAKDLHEEIELLRQQLIALAGEQTRDESRTAVDRARFDALNAREKAVAAGLAANRAQMARLLSALQLYARNPPPALLVSPGSANDAVRAAILMRAVAPILKARAEALKSQGRALERLRREAAIAHESLFLSESELADQRADLEAAILKKRALEAQLYAEAAAADIRARRGAVHRGGLPEVLRDMGPAAEGADPSEAGPRSLLRPVSGRIVAGYGAMGAGGKASQGVVFVSEPKGVVLAPGDGKVEYSGPVDGWGEVAIIDLGDGWRAVLANMDKALAGAGRQVRRGEPMGRLRGGPSPTLYLELRRGASPVDPAPRLDGKPRA